jgi:hypothetical protein
VSLEEKEGTKMKRLILIAMVVLLSAPNVIAQTFCKGDFTYDGDVDANDVTTFLEHFGRSIFNNPCPPDGPAPVAKTGQTTSYYEGDDGALGKGVEWPNPRFTDNENGTVTDNLTGLIWLKNANCFSFKTWIDGITDCNVLADGEDCGTGGSFLLTDGSNGGDWRLPNRSELLSLLDLEYLSPALSNSAGSGQWTEGDPFSNVLSTWYSSSTTWVQINSKAWSVFLVDGDVHVTDKDSYLYVWCVRGGH